MKSLQENATAIEQEYSALKQLPSDYSLKQDEHTLHKGQWDWHSFITKGRINTPFQVLAPTTSAVLQSIPDLLTGPPFAYSFMSTLKAGTTIAPHFGPANIRLRVHFPITVPAGTQQQIGIKLAGETRQWMKHQPMLFDDCYEHGVWNLTNEDRVVLLFDIWHPELSQAEREAICGMFDGARSKGWIT